MTDGPCVLLCELAIFCTFSNHFIWIKHWSLFRAFTVAIYNNTKETFQALWSCSIMLYVLIYVKEWKNIKVQHIFNFEDVVYMLHFLKLIKFTVLFYFASSDQSQIVDWLKRKSLTRYRVYPRLKTVTKTFLEEVHFHMMHFRVALLICPYRVKKTWKFWERLLMMRKSCISLIIKWQGNETTKVSFYRHWYF